jgi:hypothetical protein
MFLNNHIGIQISEEEESETSFVERIAKEKEETLAQKKRLCVKRKLFLL